VVVGENAFTTINLAHPFADATGRALSHALSAAGLARADVLLTNAVACFMGNGQGHERRAAIACRPRLLADISSHPRSAIMTLGATALAGVMGDRPIDRGGTAGEPLESPVGPVIPSVHLILAAHRPAEMTRLVRDMTTASALARDAVFFRAAARSETRSSLSTGELILSRFLANIDQSGDCWLWSGTLDKDGYGTISVRGRNVRAHRFAYELFVRPIPVALTIDHLCMVRNCVNPAHLEAVTRRENNERAAGSVWWRED
jgi:uracil-DNA glycosylase family 4